MRCTSDVGSGSFVTRAAVSIGGVQLYDSGAEGKALGCSALANGQSVVRGARGHGKAVSQAEAGVDEQSLAASRAKLKTTSITHYLHVPVIN
jgi:hypothetical protein